MDFTIGGPSTGAGQVLAGSTWNFQCWYRDSIFGLPVSNFSLPVQVTLY